MAVVGRGKGRGFTEVRDNLLRRPGQTASTKFNDLINLIDCLTISNKISDVKIDEIVQTIHESIKNNSLKETFDILYNQAFEDRQFSTKLAIVCTDPKVISIDASQFRRVLLNSVQQSYLDREEIKKKNINHVRNAASFLGNIYNKLNCNGRLDCLAQPLLDYLEMLLETSEEEDVEITMIQISLNGRYILEKFSTRLENLIMRVKMVLINRNLSARSRGMLLYIVDLDNKHFVPLSGKLQEFYINELGSDFLMYIQDSNDDLIVNTKSKNTINYKYVPKSKFGQASLDDNLELNLIKINKQKKNVQFGSDDKNVQFRSNEKSPHNINNEKLSVPRAIRGAGAADTIKDKNTKKSPRGRKDKLTDEQMWSSKQNINSKVWGHDDRFEKDYD